MRGFTLVEVLTVIFILMVLAGVTLASFRLFQRNTALDSGTQETMNILRLAQSRAASSLNNSSCGIHFESGRVVLFYGDSYNPLDSANEVSNLPSGVEIYSVSLAGAGDDLIFTRPEGRTSQPGNVSLRLISDHGAVKIIYVNSAGQAGLEEQAASLAGRVSDSRHLHFYYNRPIAIDSENIVLSFSNPEVNQSVSISNNLDADGQIYWKGAVDAGGESQILEIRTHQLNNPSTIFSVKRDRRYNTKPVNIFLSGDPGNSLVEYDADSTATAGSSVYVSGLEEQ